MSPPSPNPPAAGRIAKIDCDHCLIEAFPDLAPTETEVLRRAFRNYQRLRVCGESLHALYFIRHHEFGQISEDLKAQALDHLEAFLNITDAEALCPLSSLPVENADALRVAS